MSDDERKKIRADACKNLLEKKRLLLTVEVRTEEEADQILQWMYGNTPTMKAQLQEISWDKAVVPTNVAQALDALKKALLP